MSEPNAQVVNQLRQLLGDRGVTIEKVQDPNIILNPNKIFAADKIAAGPTRSLNT